MRLGNYLLGAILALRLTTAFGAGLGPYTESKFLNAEQEGRSIVLAFHSTSCGTCKVQAPILDSLLKEGAHQSITALQINYENSRDLRKKFRVTSPSTVIVIKGGRELGRAIGDTQEDTLRALLAKGAQ